MDQRSDTRQHGDAPVQPHTALQGIKVLDLTRLAPGPYCTMFLADMGADVIVVGGGSGSLPIPALARGKTFISLDLKSPDGRDAFYQLAATADVLVEGYRPGVTERLSIDYKTLSVMNPRLIYCSLTGYGQTGPLSQEAGHDLNYLAISGALGAFGPDDDVPSFPLNLLADFAGGSLFAALGIILALYERRTSGQGQYVDAAMIDGCRSMMAMHLPDWGQDVLRRRGDGLVAGNAPFYRCYRCSDGRFISVGAIERKFFENLWNALGYADAPPDHFDRATWPTLTARFEESFAQRPRDDWARLCLGRDTCVAPVLDPVEAIAHPQNQLRHPQGSRDNAVVAPILSRTPGAAMPVDLVDRTIDVLRRAGLSADQARHAAVGSPLPAIKGLKWPPL